eukprot:GHVT01087474.1.p2 GENE.GHVT01087474.1~~GHVT01087474.1.p2  ORF type:complete len:109 (-),score=4.68 GHVT01087474.1:849-1175(-)
MTPGRGLGIWHMKFEGSSYQTSHAQDIQVCGDTSEASHNYDLYKGATHNTVALTTLYSHWCKETHKIEAMWVVRYLSKQVARLGCDDQLYSLKSISFQAGQGCTRKDN